MYLIYGESFRLIEEEINKIIDNEENVITVDLNISTLEDVITEATYVSLFEEKKIIVVKNVHFFSSNKETEKEINLLLNYLEHPIDSTTIIFVTYEKIDLRKKITKQFKDKYKIIACNFLGREELIRKITQIVEKNHYQISQEIILYIMEKCQNNYDLIYNELNKIFLYYNQPQEIKMLDVENIVSKSLMDNNFKFVEAVVAKQYHKSLEILNDLNALKVDPIFLLMLLAREFRLIYCVSLFTSMGYRKSQIAKELSLQEWQVDKILKESYHYSLDELKKYLKTLAIDDFEIKSGRGDKHLVLKTFLLEME